MKDINIKTLGLSATITDVPTSVEEFDQMAGRQGACLEYAVQHILFHSVYETVRSLICEKVEATGFARKTKPHPTKPGVEVIDESEAAYISRYLAATGKTIEQLQQEVGVVAVPFKVGRQKQSTGQQIRLSKRDLERANIILGQDAAKRQKNLEQITKVTGITFSENPTAEDIAAALKVYRQKIENAIDLSEQ